MSFAPDGCTRRSAGAIRRTGARHRRSATRKLDAVLSKAYRPAGIAGHTEAGHKRQCGEICGPARQRIVKERNPTSRASCWWEGDFATATAPVHNMVSLVPSALQCCDSRAVVRSHLSLLGASAAVAIG